jgi:hypothetical protein
VLKWFLKTTKDEKMRVKDEKMRVKDEKMRVKDEKMRVKDEFVFCFLVFVYTDAYIATQIAKNNARYWTWKRKKTSRLSVKVMT